MSASHHCVLQGWSLLNRRRVTYTVDTSGAMDSSVVQPTCCLMQATEEMYATGMAASCWHGAAGRGFRLQSLRLPTASWCLLTLFVNAVRDNRCPYRSEGTHRCRMCCAQWRLRTAHNSSATAGHTSILSSGRPSCLSFTSASSPLSPWLKTRVRPLTRCLTEELRHVPFDFAPCVSSCLCRPAAQRPRARALAASCRAAQAATLFILRP